MTSLVNIAQQAHELHEQYLAGQLSPSEFKELVEDLKIVEQIQNDAGIPRGHSEIEPLGYGLVQAGRVDADDNPGLGIQQWPSGIARVQRGIRLKLFFAVASFCSAHDASCRSVVETPRMAKSHNWKAGGWFSLALEVSCPRFVWYGSGVHFQNCQINLTVDIDLLGSTGGLVSKADPDCRRRFGGYVRVCEDPAELSVHQKARATPGTFLFVAEWIVDGGSNLDGEEARTRDYIIMRRSSDRRDCSSQRDKALHQPFRPRGCWRRSDAGPCSVWHEYISGVSAA